MAERGSGATRGAWVAVITPDLAQERYRELGRQLTPPRYEATIEHAGSRLDTIGACADVAVVDVHTDAVTGLAAVARLRRSGSAPLLAICADADDTVVRSLQAGADHAVTLDATPRQIQARVDALLRRATVSSRRISDDEVVLDVVAGRVTVGAQTIDLSHAEAVVLMRLHGRAGRVVSRRELQDALPQRSRPSVDYIIRSIRQKLDVVGLRSRVTVVRRVGFKWDDSASPNPVASTAGAPS